MAIVHVQGVVGGDQSGTPVASTPVSLGSSVGVGNLICGAVGILNTTVTSITDDKSNTYTMVDTGTFFSGFPVVTFYLGNITNSPTTITFHFAANGTFCSAVMDEYSGVDGALGLNGHNLNVQTAVGPGTDLFVSGTFNATRVPDLIYGLIYGGGTPNAGTNFTIRQANATFGIYSEDRITASTLTGTQATFSPTANDNGLTAALAFPATNFIATRQRLRTYYLSAKIKH